MDDYITSSLELHLFFARIMKEHSLFLEVGFMPNGCNYITEARWYKEQFEKLLCSVVKMSKGNVRLELFIGGEVVTEYTLPSEKKTSQLTGSNINLDITRCELDLWGSCCENEQADSCDEVKEVEKINKQALELLDGLISLKERILSDVLSCAMFTANYPLLLKHIIREANLYRSYVRSLLNYGKIVEDDFREIELFWNQIMMEHALFIRGLLDPTESDLIMAADGFAHQYARLLKEAGEMTQRTMEAVTDKTIDETRKYRDFKATGAKGINECKVKSLILPLLADHVLREANHYLRILGE